MSEVSRLLRPAGTQLIWTLDSSHGGGSVSPATVREISAPDFELQNTRKEPAPSWPISLGLAAPRVKQNTAIKAGRPREATNNE